MFKVETRRRSARNAKRQLCKEHMGRSNRHVADALPENPTPDEVDRVVEHLAGWEGYTYFRCRPCGERKANGVEFSAGRDFRITICGDCLRAAVSRLDAVEAEEAQVQDVVVTMLPSTRVEDSGGFPGEDPIREDPIRVKS